MLSYTELKSRYPSLHEIIAVSKTFPIEAIREVMAQGYTHFGENKAQELKLKAQAGLPVTWHFIGHLQTNKVKDVVRDARWIHSVDSLKLIGEIEKEAAKQGRHPNILIQVNLTGEESKSGVHPDELEPLIKAALASPHLSLKGLMVIGPTEGDETAIEAVFIQAQHLLEKVQATWPQLSELSMGMSHDYPLAITHGATMIRIGSVLFGQRKTNLSAG